MNHTQTFFYKAVCDRCYMFKFDDIVEVVLNDNPSIVNDELITIWQDNMDRYFQLTGFRDFDFLNSYQLEQIDDAVTERLKTLIESNGQTRS